MSIIWIIENSNDRDQSITQSLMGNFPVRVFSSFSSFQKLVGLKKQVLPNLLICDADDCEVETKQLESALRLCMPEARLVFVSAKDRSKDTGDQVIHIMQPIDPLNFSCLVEHFLAQSNKQTFCIVYKNIILDLSMYSLKCAMSGSVEKLPMKEAQILKLLIERKGACVSRQQIKTEIWSDISVSTRTIDSHVSRLRKKLEEAEITIESIYGGGYSLK